MVIFDNPVIDELLIVVPFIVVAVLNPLNVDAKAITSSTLSENEYEVPFTSRIAL